MSAFTNCALCTVSVEEKADPSIPLYVLPLYSLLAPDKQAKVRLISYINTKPTQTEMRNNLECFTLKFTFKRHIFIRSVEICIFPTWSFSVFKSPGREGTKLIWGVQLHTNNDSVYVSCCLNQISLS